MCFAWWRLSGLLLSAFHLCFWFLELPVGCLVGFGVGCCFCVVWFGLGDVIFTGFSLLYLGICWACFWAFGVCCVFVLLFLSSVERGVVAMSSWVRNLDGFLGLFIQF